MVLITRMRYLIIISVCACYFIGVEGEDCIAGHVLDLRIDVGGNLTWSVSPTEPCEIEAFQVDLVGDRGDVYHFKVNTTHVNLSFLEVCEEWEFYVIPISNGVLGHQMRIIDWIPLPADADLTLLYFNITHVGKQEVLLEWELRNRTHGDCTLQYRVAVTDRLTTEIRDVYFTGHFARVSFLSPCVQYYIDIRAINTAIGGIEGPLLGANFDTPSYPLDPPKLGSVVTGPTSISTTWIIESYENNSCPVLYLYLDGGSYFNLTTRLWDPFGRPPMQINVTNLLPNTMYHFKTFVQNTGGLSAIVPMAAQTLELQPGKI
ncbi:hypothetical protein NQ315_001415 [Exocentrus adspersus]|uniref:Fibronectin type-III domain-containing protein n=1 Tax=Exocentrus adspersus TaxID=1586481 RepID=A0AAV8WFC3_9CUCU|nr:hypothetical protein NQ315_001415 [Exocentrus adspersus]